MSVGSLAYSSRMSWRKGGQGKVHSYELMVRKNDGNPNCLTASNMYRCCHFQKVAEKDFSCNAELGEQPENLEALMAPVIVFNSHRSYW